MRRRTTAAATPPLTSTATPPLTPRATTPKRTAPVRPAPPSGAAPARGSGPGGLRIEQVQPSQVVAAAGTAIVTAARVGRIFGRVGWRIARQLPGAQTLESEAQRLQQLALDEARKRLPAAPGPRPRPRPSTSPDEQRAALLIQTTPPGTAPLRAAMGELLERSAESTRTASREYLFGVIISQLVPDEARIVAAMADGKSFAAADVVTKPRGRTPSQVVLANASTVGRTAGVVTPDNVPTYLTRLQGLGLLEFGPPDDTLGVQYDILATDPAVRQARSTADAGRRNSAKIVRKTVRLSPLGREFWAATDPSRTALPAR